MNLHGINFGHNRRWSAQSDEGLMNEAKNPLLPAIMRINALAKARVNRSGHAEFGPGEIGYILQLVDKNDVSKPMSKSQVANTIKQARDAGLFDEDSSSRCIIISSRITQRNAGTGSCKHHNINKSGNEIVKNEDELVVDMETGEILESPESLSNESTLPEYQINIPSPQTGTQTPSSPITEKVEMTSEEFYEWFKTASEAEQAVASFGVLYKKRDALDKVLMVAVESVKEEYDWTVDPSMKYAYAVMNITYEGPNKTKTETEECDW